jgi:hypothetical protein
VQIVVASSESYQSPFDSNRIRRAACLSLSSRLAALRTEKHRFLCHIILVLLYVVCSFCITSFWIGTETSPPTFRLHGPKRSPNLSDCGVLLSVMGPTITPQMGPITLGRIRLSGENVSSVSPAEYLYSVNLRVRLSPHKNNKTLQTKLFTASDHIRQCGSPDTIRGIEFRIPFHFI